MTAAEPGKVEIDENEGQESQEKQEEEQQDIAEETTETFYKESKQEVDDTTQTLKRAFDNVSDSADSQMELDTLDSTYSSPADSGEAVNSSGNENPRLESAEGEAQEQREKDIGTQNRKGRIWTRTKGIAALIALFSAASSFASMMTAVLTYVRNKNQGKDDDNNGELGGLTDEQKKQLDEQIERWWKLPDAEVWDRMAQFCDRWDPSFQGQTLMMDTIKRLSESLAPPWNWQDGDNQWAAIEATIDAYADFSPGAGQSKSRAIYETVRDYRFDGFGRGPEAMPRQIAADVAELALYQIILLETGRSDQMA